MNSLLQLNLITIDNNAEAIEEILNQNGALATIVNVDGNISALFNKNTDLDSLLILLLSLFEESLKNISIEHITQKDWQKIFQDSFNPIKFGKRLWIYPSWTTPPDPNALNINIDPGLAFGTGTHPTTALCLEWLESNIKPQQTVIDYGCGSGILAIAALKLGAQKVFATDIDQEALKVTTENAEKNKINLDQLEVLLPQQMPLIKADILIANILANPLIDLAPIFANLLKPKGQVAISGILPEQTKKIAEVYQQWFDIKSIISKNNWSIIAGKRY